jgi:subtilisin family serine protease
VPGPTWGIREVGAAVDSTLSGEPVTVAILDTGIVENHDAHPAFAGMNITCENFTAEIDGYDTNGHGTHCAGTIFGRDVTVNGRATRIGVARGVRRALIGKVLGKGAGTDSLVKAILRARDNGAHVISMSLGFNVLKIMEMLAEYYPQDQATSELMAIYRENIRQLDSLLQHLNVPVQRKVTPLIIAAAGNESKADAPDKPYRITASMPAAAIGILSVGALERLPSGMLRVASFSNSRVNLVAPGVDIVSAAKNGGLAVASGTSMACPHVAGVSALVWHRLISRGDPLNVETVRTQLLASAKTERIEPNTPPQDMGLGIPEAPSTVRRP